VGQQLFRDTVKESPVVEDTRTYVTATKTIGVAGSGSPAKKQSRA
jgi:hypothetical protein